MKHLIAGEALHGHAFDKPQSVEVGKTYGHLEVVEELPKKRGAGRRFRCRCLKVDEATGRMCGQMTVKQTPELTKAAKFRACRGCTEEYMKEVRTRWNRGGSY